MSLGMFGNLGVGTLPGNVQSGGIAGQQGLATLSSDLLQQIFEDMKISWARVFDCWTHKFKYWTMAMPEYDRMNLANWAARSLQQAVWSGRKFSVKCRNNPRLNDLIQREAMGRDHFCEKMMKASFLDIHLGNGLKLIQRGVDGLPRLRLIDGLSAIPIEWDEYELKTVASISFDYLDKRTFVIVQIDNQYYRRFQLYELVGQGQITSIQFGNPMWMQVMGLANPMYEFPIDQIGYKRFAWTKSLYQHARWEQTPYTQGFMHDFNSYTQLVYDYQDYKREYKLKKAKLFVNRLATSNQFVMMDQRKDPVGTAPKGWQASYQEQNNPLFNAGVWPDTDYWMTPDFLKNDVIMKTRPEYEEEIYSMINMNEEMFYDRSPEIRHDAYMNNLNFELARYGKSHQVGENFFVVLGQKGHMTATGDILMNRDLKNWVECYQERILNPNIRDLIYGYAMYWIEDGYITPADIPGNPLDIEITWDNGALMDTAAEEAKWMQLASFGLISRDTLLRHVTKLTDDEIAQDTMQIMSDPVSQFMIRAQNQQMKDAEAASQGTKGSIFPQTLNQNLKTAKK